MYEAKPQKKQSKFGVGFYIVLVFAIIKDVSDVLFSLTIILAWIPPITGILMGVILYSYFFFIGVSLNGRKLATFAVSSIIEVVPFGGALPMATITLVAIRAMEGASEKIPSMPIAKK